MYMVLMDLNVFITMQKMYVCNLFQQNEESHEIIDNSAFHIRRLIRHLSENLQILKCIGNV